jgi:glycosyltransferase involved in cell wall biosynthesis
MSWHGNRKSHWDLGAKVKIRVVFVTSHPIQYQVPVFRRLAAMANLEFVVLFAMLPSATEQGTGFGVEFKWDIPLLEGYEFRVLDNVSASPGVSRFSGCDTPGIYDELKRLKPDAVIVNGWVVKSCLQALWACKKLGVPCLVRGEANDLRSRSWWKHLLQRVLVQQYEACLYIGKASRAFYEARGVKARKLFPSPYCIENQRFAAAAQSMRAQREELRNTWGVSADHTCFVFCGKFETKKHPVELVKSFAEAYNRRSDIYLLMVGDGELRQQCEDLVARMGLPVTFTGFLNQSEIVAAYVAADCLVLPSDAGETWGLVVNEAMACGLPAIVSDLVGCASDLIIPGDTGDVFSFGDWNQLAELLVTFSPETEAERTMGANAQAVVAAYSPEAAANGIADAVVRVASFR